MPVDTDKIRETADIVAVAGTYTTLQKRGAEFVGCCPFHADNNPSFYVSPVKGFAKCFGCGWGGDVIKIIMEAEGLDFKAAVERLGAGSWEATFEKVTKKVVETTFVSLRPPQGVASPNFTTKRYGAPTSVYPITDLDGYVLGWEVRYLVDGKKENRIWSYGQEPDCKPGWTMRVFNVPRPLFGLDQLTARPKAQVMVFEGPKKAMAGRKLFPTKACISWTGGAENWHKHDWNVLRGRNPDIPVVIWPDADTQIANEYNAKKLQIPVGAFLPYDEQPGQRAAKALATLLTDQKGLSLSAVLINVNGYTDGWDVADALADGWTPEQAATWVKSRI